MQSPLRSAGLPQSVAPKCLAPEAVVADVDDAVVVDVPEQRRALARAPGAPLDGRLGLRRRRGRLTRQPGRAARGEQHGQQDQQRDERAATSGFAADMRTSHPLREGPTPTDINGRRPKTLPTPISHGAAHGRCSVTPRGPRGAAEQTRRAPCDRLGLRSARLRATRERLPVRARHVRPWRRSQGA